MPRRGPNIYKRKDGRWEARYISRYEDGKAKYGYLYGHTYGEAKALRDEALRRLHQPKPSGEKCLGTVGEVCGLWLDEMRFSVKASTYARYRGIVEGHILPRLGKLLCHRCDGTAVNGFARDLLEAGGRDGVGLSPKTVTDVLCVLKSVIGYGRGCGYVFGFTDNIRLPPRNAKPASVLSADNRTTLERILMDSGDLTSLGVLLCLFTGLRIGELCGLRWEDVDTTAATVRVERTVERIAETDPRAKARTKLIVDKPKTRSSVREIPLPGFLGRRIEGFERKDGCYLMTGTPEPLEPNRMYMRYKSLLKKHGLEGYSFHALRHTFATRCVEMGFDVKSLSEILGHANVSTTLGVYVHPTLEQKRSQMERLCPECEEMR